MEPNLSFSRKERREYFVYLILLFTIVSTLLIWVVFRNSNIFNGGSSAMEAACLSKDREFITKQNDALPLYDTLFKRITELKGTPQNAIMETDIRNGINTLNNYYENLPTKDIRFVSFHQLALFLKLYFEDVLVLNKKLENIQRFGAQLTECEIGYKDRQTMMTQIKAAQAAAKN